MPGVQRFQWSLPRLLGGKLVCVPDTRDMPERAAEEQADLRGRGVAAILGIPVRSDHGLLGYLSMEYLQSSHSWSEDEIAQIRLAGDLFAGALRRRNAESALESRLDSERRLAELSRRFVNLDSETFAGGIRDGLAAAAGMAGAERALLVTLEHVSSPTLKTYMWYGDGIEPADPVDATMGQVRDFQWTWSNLRSTDVLYIPSVEALPPEAAAERAELQARHVKSAIGIPVRNGSELIGFLGFETLTRERVWRRAERTQLVLVAEIFGNALRRRFVEEELMSSQGQLLQAQKMEAVGRMAGGVAHDFNNLLTVILGNAHAILDGEDSQQMVREDAREVIDAAERAAELTHRLLAFSSRQIVAPTCVDLNRIAGGLEGMLTRLIGEDVELSIDLGEGVCLIEADPALLEQVLVNLIVNARAALVRGGHISVRTTHSPPPLDIAVRLGVAQDEPMVVLTVEDNGVGMDPETCARIFEPFFTTRELGEGTGLGLAIVYNVVANCGGGIDVHTRPGAGARFDLYFPSLEGNEVEAPVGTSSLVQASGTVLLVEDEPAVRRLARRMLREAGFVVLDAGRGDEALEVALAHPGSIDLLVTDVVMPQMGGVELAERLLGVMPHLKVLYVSGYPREPGRDELVHLPIGEFLPKPFTAESLVERVSQLLGRQAD